MLLGALSWLGDGCKSTDNMTFSLTDDGQEAHYYELPAQLCAGVTLWLYVDTDVFLDYHENVSKNWLCLQELISSHMAKQCICANEKGNL